MFPLPGSLYPHRGINQHVDEIHNCVDHYEDYPYHHQVCHKKCGIGPLDCLDEQKAQALPLKNCFCENGKCKHVFLMYNIFIMYLPCESGFIRDIFISPVSLIIAAKATPTEAITFPSKNIRLIYHQISNIGEVHYINNGLDVEVFLAGPG